MLALLAVPLLLSLFCLWLLLRQGVLPEPEYRSLALVAGFGASIGGLTLWMMVLGLLPGRYLSAATIAIFPVAAWGIGLWLTVARSRKRRAATEATPEGPPSRPANWGRRWLWLAIAGSLAVSLIHSLYYPFVGEDELSRYAYFARLIFEAGRIPPSLYGYPLLLPFGYAYAFFLGGGINEHLAKIVSWAFAPATVAATYWLASVWAGRRAGLLAAFVLAVTRLFVRWSPMGYLDIPTGLYYALAGVFVSLWLQKREMRFALLAGLAAGLAMWTKQAGLPAALSLGLVFLLAWGSGGESRRRVMLHGAAALGLAALIAGPWYLRNVALGGIDNVAPAASVYSYEKARRAWFDWIPFLGWAGDFGYGVAPLYLGGMLAGLAMLFRPHSQRNLDHAPTQLRITDYALRITPRTVALLHWLFILPYLALWWNWFSYDARYLLTVLPFYAAFVGIGAEWVLERFASGRSAVARPPGDGIAGTLRTWMSSAAVQSGGIALVAAALLLGGTYNRLGGVYRLVVAPFATDQERLLHIKPDVASTVAYLREAAVPGRDRIYSMDPRINFYLADYDMTVGYPTELAQLDGYQYFVTGSWAFNLVYSKLGAEDNEIAAHIEDPHVFELLFTSELGTVKVYRVQMLSSHADR